MKTDAQIVRDLEATLGRIQACRKGLDIEVEALKKLNCTVWQIRAAANYTYEGGLKIHELIQEIATRIDILKECPADCTMLEDGCWKTCPKYQDARKECREN